MDDAAAAPGMPGRRDAAIRGEFGGRLPRTVAGLLGPALLVVGVVGGTALAAASQSLDRRPMDLIGWVLVAAVIGIALSPRRPVAALVAAAGVVTVILAAGYAYGPVILVLSWLAFRAADRASGRGAAFGCGLAVVLLTAAQLVPGWRGSWTDLLTAGAVAIALVGVPAWLGTIRRIGRAQRAADAQRLRLAEEADGERRARALADQRLALSRDLHDTVAHSLSLISLHSGAALHVADQDPQQAQTALRTIRTASTEALGELRAVVAALREGPADALPQARGSAGVTGIPDLAQRINGWGLEVRYSVEGAPRAVPPDVDDCLFRVAQESLTNVIRHSGARHARVVLRYEPGTVQLEVGDDGTTDALAREPGGGITGMRERVAALGGSFRAGAGAGGGFLVSVRLPAADDGAHR